MKTFYVRSASQRAGFSDWLAKLPEDAGLEITVREHKGRRTIEQNARMWALLTMISLFVEDADGAKHPKEWWKEQFRYDLLEAREIRLANGRIVHDWPGTSELDRSEFAKFMTEIEVWAAERGVSLGD